MIDFIEKTMLAGFGALSLTQKKSEELLKEVKERVELTEEEGKRLLSRCQEIAQENQQKLADLARDEIKAAGTRMGFVSKADYEVLAKKVAKLEKQLKTKI